MEEDEPDQEDYNYEDDYGENINMEDDKIIGGNYELLTKDEMDKERNKKIDEFIQISDLSKSQAELVLMNNNWNIDVLMNDWYDKTQKYKENSGIAQTKASQEKLNKYFQKHKIPSNYCLVCETEIAPGDCICLECNHQFCFYCFKEYLKEKTKDQLTLLATKCPMQFCNFQVPSEIFLKVFEGEKKELDIYNKCLMRNFTESNSDIKLCPNPQCDIIIKLPGHGMIEVKCHCGLTFCFKCLREGHRPCDCEMMQYWEDKNKSDGENTKWLIVNTKQCPNCHKYIEKNQGCNHMTCRKEAGGCGYEFCWICLGEWKPHGSSWYECKKYSPTELDKNKEKIRNNMKLELERYANFYESYQEEEKAIKFGMKLKDKIDDYKKQLETIKHQPHTEVLFLDDALRTVIECHHILKNTYIFGYYMKNINTASLYKHHQEMLRRNADLLHDKIEMKYLQEIMSEENLESFNKKFISFKGEVLSLIGATVKFKENILEEIEKHPEYIDYNVLKSSASGSTKK
jgi:ariadne-1